MMLFIEVVNIIIERLINFIEVMWVVRFMISYMLINVCIISFVVLCLLWFLFICLLYLFNIFFIELGSCVL